MKSTFNVNRVSRQVYDRFFDNYSTEQLNKIPPGFSNNLIWNIGHIIVSQQMLMYLASGNTPNVSIEMIERYKRGTRPESDASSEEIAEIRSMLFTLVDKSEEDYNAGVFTTYTERKTELGFTLTSIEDAIEFNNYHEATHLGIMMSLRKFV
ncbi:DinB family protein [Flavobacterium sp. J372]|uniref:DinB family protein n=1 Tax=Flavobacterium sp. J372 TaxID=2898436 RepID=UPI002150F2B8|nr:DinB family protein [Flavobacterium sp. J372]MCR5861040.1 DinB family protein [Flavobacterium sp. J372]